MITPIIAMPQISSIVRGSFEECQNTFDANTRLTSATEVVSLHDGSKMLFVCRKLKSGAIVVTIRNAKKVTK